MEIKFYTPKGVMDLSKVKFSTQEENSMMKDATFTKFTFPFEIHVDDVFISTFGDYISDESKDIETVIEGLLFHENKTHKAKLTLESTEDEDVLIGQIDYGFDEIPNYDKKLSELPFENFDVVDIYAHAEDIVTKKWPQTNYNFPRIYTKKYSPEDEIWDAFNGYYNGSSIENGILKMKRNYIDSNGNIFNVNIIHPCPHPIYILKTGFRDAGFDLIGDILSDPDLQDRWVFSGTEYFSTLAQKRYNFIVNTADSYNLEYNYNTIMINGQPITVTRKYGRFYHSQIIEKAGDYKILGWLTIVHWLNDFKPGTIVIKVNDSVIFQKIFANGVPSLWPIEMDFVVNTANSTLSIEAYTAIADQDYDICNFEIIGKALEANSATIESKVVTNLNKVDLRKAVPEMTFGDFVNGIKNWFNYDFEVVGSKIYMNRLGKSEPMNILDFSAFAVKNPKKTFLQNRSFQINFPEMDSPYKLDSIYYDVEGVKLNGLKKSDTTVIDIKGYPLPVAKAKENSDATAIDVMESSDVISLVYYDGFVNGLNDSKYVPGCTFPELFEKNWLKWLRQRIKGRQYQWSKEVNAELFSQVNIKRYIACNNNIHLFVSINKDKIGDDTYMVDIITETIS